MNKMTRMEKYKEYREQINKENEAHEKDLNSVNVLIRISARLQELRESKGKHTKR